MGGNQILRTVRSRGRNGCDACHTDGQWYVAAPGLDVFEGSRNFTLNMSNSRTRSCCRTLGALR